MVVMWCTALTTNSADYLRDNMAFSMADKSQGMLAFAIVDEVDSILIDEARTPLIISGAADDSSELYKTVNRLIPKLSPELEAQEGDYTVDEKQRSIELTEQGHEKVEGMLIEAGLTGRRFTLCRDKSWATASRTFGFARPCPVSTRCRVHRSGGSGCSDRRTYWALCLAAVCRRDCIRPLKRKRASRFRARVRHWPQPPFKTFSGFTTSWRV